MDASRSTAVIIAAKDAAATAAGAVSSALGQRLVSEVVFVDDGSKDDTSAVARSVDDGSGRLRVIRLDRNHGPAHARNLAIEASSAPFVCILDADDFMSEGRIERLFELGGDGWDLVADDIFFCTDEDRGVAFDRLLPPDCALPFDLTLSRFAIGNLPDKNRYRRELGFLKPLIRRAFIDAHDIRYDERLRLGEDLLLYARCLADGAVFKVVEACGYYAVQYPQSLSGRQRTEDIAALYHALVEFEHEAAAAGRPAGELSPYTRSTRNNLALRRALDAKRQGGWLALLAEFGASPRSAPFVVGKVARDKVGSAMDRIRL